MLSVLLAAEITNRFKVLDEPEFENGIINSAVYNHSATSSRQKPWRETRSNFSYFSALISPEPITLGNNS